MRYTATQAPQTLGRLFATNAPPNTCFVFEDPRSCPGTGTIPAALAGPPRAGASCGLVCERMRRADGPPWQRAPRAQGGPLKTGFFFKDLKYCPKGPPTATNRQLPPTANRQSPPTASRQPPTANRQSPPTANRQLSPTANRQSPPTASRQPPIATNRQSPTANRQPPIATNRQPPITTNHG